MFGNSINDSLVKVLAAIKNSHIHVFRLCVE